MKKYKLSPWHDGSVKPVHVGVYYRKYGKDDVNDHDYSYWDGECWLLAGDSIRDALEECTIFGCEYPSANQSLKWRGILK